MAEQDLRALSTHFKFGENWASYARTIDQTMLDEAKEGLVRLFGQDGLRGKTFLDIGCGSGIHSTAAACLGATTVRAVDLDPVSVETTRQTLARFAPDTDATAEQVSVFTLDPEVHGRFDVVYSWGVLHHTGAMNDAIRRAAATVAPDGLLALAMYRKTALCAAWKVEKRWYAKASPKAQAAARSVFITLFRLGLMLSGRSYASYVATYKSARGMDHLHDVHDWMGGYPYESASASDMDAMILPLGFTLERSFTRPFSLGLFGSGCDEYVYRRGTPPAI